MKILDYIIPEDHQNNNFVKSLFTQFEKKGQLSQKQEQALRSAIDIEEDFLEYDVEIDVENLDIDDFKLLKAKFQRNRFKFTRTKNICINAMKSIIYGNPDYGLINKALNRDYDWRFR